MNTNMIAGLCLVVTLLIGAAAGTILGCRMMSSSARQPELAGTLQTQFLLAMGILEIVILGCSVHFIAAWYV